MPVVVPFVVPCSMIDAPTMGCPDWSEIVPEMTGCCAMAAGPERSSADIASNAIHPFR